GSSRLLQSQQGGLQGAGWLLSLWGSLTHFSPCRKAGLGSGLTLTAVVHPALNTSSTQLVQAIDLFGEKVEELLLKHGTKIIEEQFVLKRVADSAIDLYAMVVVISRATRSL
uniref:ACAD9/ACADV-like C-terminal domain-containing protein n=1 Tax=Sphenodon punctatus TaxID=8508 RepID=A0A8D0HL04_SPHPU